MTSTQPCHSGGIFSLDMVTVMQLSRNPFAIILLLAAADALIGGTFMAALQKRGWDARAQKINNWYQVGMFVVCLTLVDYFCELHTILEVGILWLFYVEDILFYWLLPPLRPLHHALTGYAPTYERPLDIGLSIDLPIPSFYIRPSYRGALGFVLRRNFPARSVCIMALAGIIIVLLT